MLNDSSSGSNEQALRVSVSEAARLFGVDAKTIRRAIKQQQIRYIVVRNRYKILFSSLVSWSQLSSVVQKRRDERGIGQWVAQWTIRNTKYSPRPPTPTDKEPKTSASG